MPKVQRFTVSDGEMVLRKLEPAEEGGYVVTSPFDPELVTEAESIEKHSRWPATLPRDYVKYGQNCLASARKAPAKSAS